MTELDLFGQEIEIPEPMKQLDYGQAVVFLEKAIAEKGEDFVYEPEPVLDGAVYGEYDDKDEVAKACVYFSEGQPSCIVGHVLSYMGYGDGEAPEGTKASMAVGELGIETDTKTVALLNAVQEKQDNGVPWGAALRCAMFGDESS